MSWEDVPKYKRNRPDTATRFEAVSASTVTFNPPLDGIHCNVAGTITFVPSGGDGSSTVGPLTINAGVSYKWGISKITALDGGAAVTGLYTP